MSESGGRGQSPHKGVKITPPQQMISSCSGALLTSLFMTPLDVVKIRLQSQAKPAAFTKGHCFVYCNGLMDHVCPCVNGVSSSSQWYKRPGHFTGTFDALIKIARYEGVTSLWSGLPPTLVMAVPATVVYFTSYEQLKAMFGYRDNVLGDQWKPMAAGAIARVWAATIISPIEMVRTKVQSVQYTYTQAWRAVVDTVRVQGPKGIWRGLGPTLLRDVPFSAMYWTGYEAMKTYVLNTKGRTSLTFYESFAAGATAGSIAAVITLPFDVIKTRRQIELGQAEMLGNTKEVSSTWKLIHRIYTSEGVKSLYTGLLPRLIKVAPSCAIMISTYEFFKQFFMSRNERFTEEMAQSSLVSQLDKSRIDIVNASTIPSSVLPPSSAASDLPFVSLMSSSPSMLSLKTNSEEVTSASES